MVRCCRDVFHGILERVERLRRRRRRDKRRRKKKMIRWRRGGTALLLLPLATLIKMGYRWHNCSCDDYSEYFCSHVRPRLCFLSDFFPARPGCFHLTNWCIYTRILSVACAYSHESTHEASDLCEQGSTIYPPPPPLQSMNV